MEPQPRYNNNAPHARPNPTQVRPYSDDGVTLPPPGYLAATSRGVTRYVPRDDAPPPRRPTLTGDVLPPAHQVDTPVPVRTAATITGDYKNRAEGFRVAMTPVAIVAGVLAVTAAVGLAGVPFLSFATMLWFFTAFCLTWLIGYALHTWVSPDGTALTMVLLHYKLLRNEQDARLDRLARWEDTADEN